jgi:hypothetical protein
MEKLPSQDDMIMAEGELSHALAKGLVEKLEYVELPLSAIRVLYEYVEATYDLWSKEK